MGGGDGGGGACGWEERREREGEEQEWVVWACVGVWEDGGRRLGEEGWRERATDSIEPQNSHKQSLLSGLDQEHPLLECQRWTLVGEFYGCDRFNCHFGSRSISDV